MTTILAIDPGSQLSGWVTFKAGSDRPIVAHGKDPNDYVLEVVQNATTFDVLAIEWMESSFGSHIGKEVTETLFWVGRFCEAAAQRGIAFERISRNALRKHMTGKVAIKGADAAVRGALTDRFGGIGGRAVAVGVKSQQGPLYGVVADEWQAVAVACVYADQHS